MRDVVPEAQHTQTMELSPGKSEYPARVLEDLVMVDELAAKNLDAFLTRAPNSKGWCVHGKTLLTTKRLVSRVESNIL